MNLLHFIIASSIALIRLTACHPDPEDESAETLLARNLHLGHAARSLEACQHVLARDESLHARRMLRRQELVDRHFAGLGKRDERALVTPWHKRQAPDPSTLFTDIQCILTPETTLGPYYIKDEIIRNDIREGQPGVPLLLDLQFVDTRTCKVVPNLYVSFWHCNSTGIYGGVKEMLTYGGTFLRGMTPTDSDGIVQMQTIFPGWYTGRALHIHILAHTGGTVSSDGKKYAGGTRPHIGQLFFDPNLVSQVQKVAPYSSNKMQLFPNNQDSIFVGQNTGYNAVMKTELLGSSLQNDGILAWISVGLNMAYNDQDKSSGGETGDVAVFPPGYFGTQPATTAATTTTRSTTTGSTMRSSTTSSRATTTTSAGGNGGVAQKWGQCGGIGWTGPTSCVSGSTCTYSNAYYSQCL